ncbi:hypothetical protein C8Q76DRAFT_783457 [Earliella scabrosa]|nr:hypothetical protein C8Q76DRAFT_783457 [Earliella scabrosa]
MPSATLESIPTELWKDIVTLSCTDGGYTGRSLALTSKFVHTQSWPWRLHSVALTSLQDLENLLVFLRTAERQPSIEHLYLSFADESTIKPPSDLWTTYWCLSEEERETYNDKSGRAKQAWDARFAPAITEMLALAGPTLRTLCIIEERPVRLPSFTHGVFPKLEELTLHGYILPIFPVDQVKAALSKSRPPAQPLISELSARLPALQRLHLVHTSGRRLSSSDAVNCIAHLAPPNLTHLRLSDVHRGAILSWEVMVGGADLDEIDAWESIPMKLPRISQFVGSNSLPPPVIAVGGASSQSRRAPGPKIGTEERTRSHDRRGLSNGCISTPGPQPSSAVNRDVWETVAYKRPAAIQPAPALIPPPSPTPLALFERTHHPPYRPYHSPGSLSTSIASVSSKSVNLPGAATHLHPLSLVSSKYPFPGYDQSGENPCTSTVSLSPVLLLIVTDKATIIMVGTITTNLRVQVAAEDSTTMRSQLTLKGTRSRSPRPVLRTKESRRRRGSLSSGTRDLSIPLTHSRLHLVLRRGVLRISSFVDSSRAARRLSDSACGRT